MKKAGLYLLLAFTLNFIGNMLWFLAFILDEPIFGSKYWEEFMLILIYTLNGIFGLIGSFLLYKKASSLILFSKIDELNLVKENRLLDGKKFIKVPVLFVLPLAFRGAKAFPSLNPTKYSFLSLNTLKVNFSDNALTTETPTP